ncbi:hypothetical protein HDU98_000690 [Podochytrium sp. JEL0797]|nr:hypothetical protein HDU98_000690 [Podochytrium sp. JEL0797]
MDPELSLASILSLLNQITSTQSRMELRMNQLAGCWDSSNQRIDSLESRMDTLHSSLQSSIDTLTSSMEGNAIRLKRIENATKKFHTRFTTLPSEVIALVLSWIHPKVVWKLRRLSHSFKIILSSKSFALLNLSRFVAAPDLTRLESLGKPSDIDISYMKAPISYQTVYIQRHLNHLHSIRWGIDESENDVPHTLQLASPFPTALLKSKHLVRLALVKCNITGPIPIQIAHVKTLQELDLDTNALCGPIPDKLAELTHLTCLVLSNNRLLSGPLPAAFGRLSNLEFLVIRNTGVSGPIPTSYGNLGNLKRLVLEGNGRLSGEIPRESGQLANVEYLLLGGCGLSGEIPVELGGLRNLVELELYDNMSLSGEVPAGLGALERLELCDLRGCLELIVSGVEFREGVLLVGDSDSENEEGGGSDEDEFADGDADEWADEEGNAWLDDEIAWIDEE